MSEVQLDSSLAAAASSARMEQLRHPAPRDWPDTLVASNARQLATSGSQSSSGDELMEIWRLLPNLKDLPEGLLRKLTPEAVFQLNSALGKDLKSTAKLTVNARLSQNAKKLAANPTVVETAADNRKDVIHPARFLGGTTCPNTELWLAARRYLGDKGIPALGNYDLDSVGCGGCVSPKAWEALHNPSSQELKIKMFYLPNVAGGGLSAKRVNLADGEEALNIGDNLKEIADLEGYRAALNTAREAMHCALPWNRSFSAIVGFMTNTNYLEEDLRRNPKRAAILSEFTDYVLGRNALNWDNGQPFLTTDELAHVWSQWRGKRASLFSSGSSNRPTEKLWSKDKRSTICRRFNQGNCPKQNDKDCKSFFGTTLRHVCNKYIGQNKQCEQSHPRSEHK